MRDDREAMMVVRAELSDRLERLRRLADCASPAAFDESLDGIRLLASAYGLVPVARIAEAFQRAGSGGRRGACPASLYIERLRDAIGCERMDDEAVQSMLASVSIRLSA